MFWTDIGTSISSSGETRGFQIIIFKSLIAKNAKLSAGDGDQGPKHLCDRRDDVEKALLR